VAYEITITRVADGEEPEPFLSLWTPYDIPDLLHRINVAFNILGAGEIHPDACSDPIAQVDDAAQQLAEAFCAWCHVIFASDHAKLIGFATEGECDT
jgi:hypothetical protein